MTYCMTMVNMLLGHGIKPIMVFDGRHLPSKKETEIKRRENRDANRKKAAQASQRQGARWKGMKVVEDGETANASFSWFVWDGRMETGSV